MISQPKNYLCKWQQVHAKYSSFCIAVGTAESWLIGIIDTAKSKLQGVVVIARSKLDGIVNTAMSKPGSAVSIVKSKLRGVHCHHSVMTQERH
jgi:hypothetical protein